MVPDLASRAGKTPTAAVLAPWRRRERTRRASSIVEEIPGPLQRGLLRRLLDLFRKLLFGGCLRRSLGVGRLDGGAGAGRRMRRWRLRFGGGARLLPARHEAVAALERVDCSRLPMLL